MYVAWVAGEVREPERNVPRALIMGVLAVILIYCAINAAYLYALPVTGLICAPRPCHFI